MIGRTWLGLLLGLSTTAQADPFWERRPAVTADVGLALVVNLGELPDRKRFGLGLDAGASGLWFEDKHGWDGPSPLSPAGRLHVHAGWTAPFVYGGVSVQGGAIYP